MSHDSITRDMTRAAFTRDMIHDSRLIHMGRKAFGQRLSSDGNAWLCNCMRVYAFVCVSMHSYACLYIGMRLHIYVCVSTYTYACLYICVGMYVYMYVGVCMHTYAFALIQMRV